MPLMRGETGRMQDMTLGSAIGIAKKAGGGVVLDKYGVEP